MDVDGLFASPQRADDASSRNGARRAGVGMTVLDPTFAGRVAVLMRSRPIADAWGALGHQDIPDGMYDIATLTLAAIDLVISQQGFEEEATYEEVVAFLTGLAATAAPGRPAEEHLKVARFAVNYLLNRHGNGTRFNYLVSDYAAEGHQWLNVGFWLLKEHEDPVRGVAVLTATKDAINALVGGLEFDVEDEQIANEAMLEKQLARGAFDAAEKSALKHQGLSVAYADEIAQILRDTRRDLRAVMGEWVEEMPARLERARTHIADRLESESRLLLKARESLESDDPNVTAAAARIAARLDEGRRRHELLHNRVINARSVFLDEQERQSFRPPASTHLVDVASEVLNPVLQLPLEPAQDVTAAWLAAVSGPVPPRIPRLYRLINDLWTVKGHLGAVEEIPGEEEVGEPDPPLVALHILEAVTRIAHSVELPARLSALLAACLTDRHLAAEDRHQAADLMMLAVLWFYSPETDEDDDEPRMSVELAATLFGQRAVADTDDTPLRLPGWVGDDLVIAEYADQLESGNDLPEPFTDLDNRHVRRTA